MFGMSEVADMSMERPRNVCAHLDGGQAGAQAGAQELVGAEGRDADEAAQVDQVDPLQVVQRQLVVEQLRELDQLAVVHPLTGAHL